MIGVCEELEDQANELLRQSLEGVFSHSEKADILTPWKQSSRWRREVYTSGSSTFGHVRDRDDELLGQPDKSIRLGMLGRAYNRGRTDLNSRDGLASSSRVRTIGRNWVDGGLTNLEHETMGWFGRGQTITREEWRRRYGY